MPETPVVITGMGVVSSLGLGRETFWRALTEGRCGLTNLENRTDGEVVPGPGTAPAGLRIGGAVTDFDPKHWVRPRKALKVMCREIQTSFAAAQMAIDDARLTDAFPATADGPIAPARVGTVFGSEMFYGPPAEMVDAFRECVRPDGSVDGSRFGNAAIRGIMPLWMLKYLPNMPACHVGIAVNAHGPNNTLVQGDVSGPAAVIEAVACIRRGLADVVISGATGTRLNATRMNYRGDTPLAPPADPIAHTCRAHDPAALGTVCGEASAAVTLEPAPLVSRRGGRPLAEIVAVACRFAASPALAKRVRSAEPQAAAARGSAAAVADAVDATLEASGLSPRRLGLIVGHGMGDPQSDAAEREGLSQRCANIPYATPIPAVGHAAAASGMMGLITAVAAIHRRTIPPTLNAETATGVRPLATAAPLEGDHVLALAHNADGNCTAILLRVPAQG